MGWLGLRRDTRRGACTIHKQAQQVAPSALGRSRRPGEPSGAEGLLRHKTDFCELPHGCDA